MREDLAVPVVLGRNLRQQEAAAGASGDDQSIAAGKDVVDVGDALDGTHHGNLQLDPRPLVRCDRMEAWVAERGVEGAGDDGANHRLARDDGADAASEVALARAKCDERAGRASESVLEAGLRDVQATAGQGALNRM